MQILICINSGRIEISHRTPFAQRRSEMARGNRTNNDANGTGDENPQLNALLQGLERVTRVAMEYEQRQHREVDTFFEYYRSFTSLRPPTFDGTGDFAAT